MASNREVGVSEQQDSHSGVLMHWVEIMVMVVGALVSSGGLIAGSYPVFWIGVAIVVITGIIAMATGILGDVELDPPRVVPELSHDKNGPTYRGVRPSDPRYLVPDDSPHREYVTDTSGETEQVDTAPAAGDRPA